MVLYSPDLTNVVSFRTSNCKSVSSPYSYLARTIKYSKIKGGPWLVIDEAKY